MGLLLHSSLPQAAHFSNSKQFQRRCSPLKPSVRSLQVRAVSNPFPTGPDGDERLQDTLVDMLNVQIGQQHVKSYFNDESERLREAAEEAKAEVDKLNQLELDRSSLAFSSAMADINQSADDFEKLLQAQRREMEADEENFEEWQNQMAVDRSRGHFFKSLYPAKIPKANSTVRQAAVTEQPKALPQPTPAPGNLQLVACSFLVGVLAMAVAADATGPAPSWGLDGLYVAIGIGLACTAWSQRNVM